MTLVAEPSNQSAVTIAVEQSALKDVRGSCGKTVVATLCDVDMMGELASRSNERKGPLDEGRLKKLLQGIMAGRGSERHNGLEACGIACLPVMWVCLCLSRPSSTRESHGLGANNWDSRFGLGVRPCLGLFIGSNLGLHVGHSGARVALIGHLLSILSGCSLHVLQPQCHVILLSWCVLSLVMILCVGLVIFILVLYVCTDL